MEPEHFTDEKFLEITDRLKRFIYKMYEPGAKLSSVVDNTKKRKLISSENVQYEKKIKLKIMFQMV